MPVSGDNESIIVDCLISRNRLPFGEFRCTDSPKDTQQHQGYEAERNCPFFIFLYKVDHSFLLFDH